MRSRHRAILLAALVLALAPVLSSHGVRAAGKTHVVAKGHSLWKIARRYNVTVDALRDKNGLEEGEPIRPGQVLTIPEPNERSSGKSPKRESHADESKGQRARHWVLQKPGASTQTQRSPKERGGVNPCLSPDPGFGVYDRWSRASSMGQMIAPQRWVRVMDGAVLVGIDLGIGSGPYSAAFRAPDAFPRLVKSVEDAMAKKHGRQSAHARKIGLSAWSAGYGAVGEIINQPYGRSVVDVVILLDGLHSGYGPQTLTEAPLEPFVRFAREARARRKLMFVSHSSIVPPGYASTTETANYLIYKLGGRPRKARPRAGDPWGLELISRYSRGNFHVRGYRGNDKMDHCAHIGLYRDVLKVHVKPRWGSPRGYQKRR
jgi:LysM repeat protein